MTREDDFHIALDNDPDDWQTRMVFADWLQDRGDARADGYRALALRHLPDRTSDHARVLMWHWWRRGDDGSSYPSERVSLPADWYDRFPAGKYLSTVTSPERRDFPTRREAEDEAARAFAQLPPERRAELLALPLQRT